MPTIASHIAGAAAEQEWNREALAAPVTAPRAALWHYDGTAVVLGCSQPLSDSYPTGLPMVKRSAGGGAVLVGPWMLSLSVVLPHEHPLAAVGLVESYRWLGQLIANELSALGIDAHALVPAELPPSAGKLNWACFGGLSPWEVVVAGRKIAGLAQRRCRHGVLLAAGILVGDSPWPLLCTAMDREQTDAAQLEALTMSCAKALGRVVSIQDLSTTLERSLGEILFSAVAAGNARQPQRHRAAIGLGGHCSANNP